MKPERWRITYRAGKCADHPFVIILERPLTAAEIYLPEVPEHVRYAVYDALDKVTFAWYEQEMRRKEMEKFPFYR